MKMRTLIPVVAVLFAAFTLVVPIRAQSIDYAMFPPNGIESPAGTPFLVGGGFQLMLATPGSAFSPGASSTLADIRLHMGVVSNSYTTMEPSNPGVLYKSVSLEGVIAAGTQLYLLASTSSTFEPTAPWALVSGSQVGWLSPNPVDPFASSIINLWATGDTVVASGFGGPGVGAYFVPPGNGTTVPPLVDPSSAVKLILVPEPSTFALLLMSAAGALWCARRRR
jgi:hypothetical protein